MIVVEFYRERSDGVRLIRTYSDEGKYIKRDGIVYTEAIDPDGLGRVYEETNEYIQVEDPEEENPEEEDQAAE